jgi:hypothetical protein
MSHGRKKSKIKFRLNSKVAIRVLNKQTSDKRDQDISSAMGRLVELRQVASSCFVVPRVRDMD